MSQSSGPFLASSHGPPGFTPRLPTSTSSPLLKRTTNGPMSIGNPTNTSIGSNMNVPPSTMRPSSSMGTLKSNSMGMNPMDKSNSIPYSSRYTRKVWPMSRNVSDKNIRGYEEHEHSYMRSNLPSHNVPPDTLNNSSFTIEPAVDDDEGDDIIFSARHMAAARFQRNQRLLHEIFNEVCIPDLRSNISVDRISTLRRQVNALKTHRETFEKDLQELEEKHVEKKRRFLEANEKFHNEYAEASTTNLTQEKIAEILQKHEAMEKLQKEKQLLALQQQQQQQQQQLPPPPQQQQTVATLPQAAVAASPAPITVSQPIAPPTTKTEPLAAVEIPQQSIPPPPPVQTQIQSAPSTPPSLPSVQHVPTPQSVPSQIPPQPQTPVQSQIPTSQPIPPPPSSVPQPPVVMPHVPQPTAAAALPPPSQQQQQPTPVMAQNPQAIPPAMAQLPPTAVPPVMAQATPMMGQVSSQQQPLPPASVPQGYPMMHTGGGTYQPVPGYGHPQQAQQYRQPMPQRSAQYPPNVQWQQQQQQQWQQSAYDSRYYHPYPPNVQWSPQQQQQQQQQPPPPQQQWAPNQPQQAMGGMPQQQAGPMRGPPHQQQAPPPHMYHNNPHYSYGGPAAGWNPNAHPPQSYSYPQNPSYDPSQQQYYPPQQQQQMHNPPQGYDYGPPPPQQQMPPQ